MICRSGRFILLSLVVLVSLIGRDRVSVLAQDVPQNIPAEWLVPIGGGGAAAGAGAAGGDAGGAQNTVPLGAGAADTQPIGAGVNQQQPAVDPNTVPAGAGAVVDQQQPAVDPNTVPLGAGAATNQPIGAGVEQQPSQQQVATDPNAAAATTPTDPNAAAATTPTDPNAAAGTPTDPNAGTTPGSQIPVESDKGSETDEPQAPPSPPAPPKNWEFLPEDKTMIFGLELHGPSLVPWTKTKSWNFVQTLHEYVFQSTDVTNSIEVGVTDSYRKQTKDENIPGSSDQHKMDSGIQMRLSVNTNSIRVESEVKSLIQAIQSGELAKDLSIALGSEVTNITMITDPEIVDYNSVPDPNESTGGSLPGWIIGAIIGGIVVLIPIPAYLLYRRSKRKHLEALAKQQAEAAAARQRMQSRIIKSTGKSFSGYQNPADPENYSGLESGLSGQDIGYGQQLTPNGSMTGRQLSGSWANHGRSPSNGLMVRVDSSGRSFSQTGTPLPTGYAGGSPTRTLQQQQQRALYQQNSLGPGGMPSVNRMGSYTGMPQHTRVASGSVYPVRYSDSGSPSSSSGNLSEPRR
jgi:hypothetical protein